MYATNSGGSWKTTQIAGTNDGMFNSIASDKNGTIHLAYYDSANNKLYYINNYGGSWSSPKMIDAGGKYVSLAVDSAGSVHVAYQDSNSQKVMYADNTAGSWSSPVVVDNTGISGQGISLAVDSFGKSYISYYESINSQLRFATNVNGTWVNEQVANTGLVAPFTSIAMNDSTAHVMIVYYDQTHQSLKSIFGSSGSWSPPMTIDSIVGAPFSSVAADSKMGEHVAYYDKVNGALKYAMFVNGTWQSQTIDTGAYSNGVLSIKLDSYDRVDVAYMSAASHLMYITSNGSRWSLSPLETVGDVGSQSLVAVDSSGYTHIVYIDRTNASNPELMYLTDISGSWQDELIANHATAPSMALSSSGKVYVSYMNNSSSQTLRYATNANGAWVENIVDSGNVGSVSSIALGNNGTMFIAYRADSSSNLFVAEYANDTRVGINARDTDHITNSNMTLLLDSNNKVYVVYTTSQGLKMVTNKQGTWLTSIVDARVVSGLSVLMDSHNDIQADYYIIGTNELVYRTYDGSAWSSKDTVQSGVAVAGTSLMLDSNGEPRIAISAIGQTNNSLRVMEKVGGVWMSSDADTSSIGASVSAAVDKYDRYHVVYYGTATQDLLYAVSITTPTSPSNVNGTRGDHFVQLSWATPTSNGGAAVTNYVIYRGESPGTETYLGQVSGTTLLYDDTSVTNGNTEYYTVVAVNSEGASVASHEFALNPYSTSSTADSSSLMLLIIAGVIAIVVIAVVVIVMMRRVRPKNKWKQ